tara:strand:+ start:183 stop:1076 length:894 start_codon:yes stop_codon:yes gene_type:complete
MSLDYFFDVEFPWSYNSSDFENYKDELFDNFEKNKVINLVSANKNSEIIIDDKTAIFRRFPYQDETLDNWIKDVDDIGGIKSFEENSFEGGVEKIVKFNSSSYFLDKNFFQGSKRLIFMNNEGIKFRNKIVEEYSRVIPHLYKKGNFNSKRTVFQDFFQECVIDISDFLNYYSRDKNVKFFTFAYHCLNKSLFRKFNADSRIRTATNEFEEGLLSYGDVEESREFVSDARMDFEEIIGNLNSFEQKILKMHYFEDKTSKEISDILSLDNSLEYGVGRGNINRVKIKAIEKLRKLYDY